MIFDAILSPVSTDTDTHAHSFLITLHEDDAAAADD